MCLSISVQDTIIFEAQDGAYAPLSDNYLMQ